MSDRQVALLLIACTAIRFRLRPSRVAPNHTAPKKAARCLNGALFVCNSPPDLSPFSLPFRRTCSVFFLAVNRLISGSAVARAGTLSSSMLSADASMPLMLHARLLTRARNPPSGTLRHRGDASWSSGRRVPVVALRSCVRESGGR